MEELQTPELKTTTFLKSGRFAIRTAVLYRGIAASGDLNDHFFLRRRKIRARNFLREPFQSAPAFCQLMVVLWYNFWQTEPCKRGSVFLTDLSGAPARSAGFEARFLRRNVELVLLVFSYRRMFLEMVYDGLASPPLQSCHACQVSSR